MAEIVPTPNAVKPPRLESVDLLRGLVIVLMALDHARGFFTNIGFDPLDLSKTTVPEYLTRWITHFCAPVFILLSGTGIFLSTTRGKTTRELSWFLLTRGLWLVFLDVVVVRCTGWDFHFGIHYIMIGIIWTIGWSMVVMAALVYLPIWAITLGGLGLVVLHDLLDGVKPESFGAWHWLWRFIHKGGEFSAGHVTFNVWDPLIPWVGVMAAGYGFGTLLLREPVVRRRWMAGLGTAMIAVFILLRFGNFYGDPVPWSPQKNALFTVLSFVHCEKYPPSLCYLLMTLGPTLLALAWFDRGTPALLKPLLVFGRVPLFFYLLHIPLIHALDLAVTYIRYGHAEWLYGRQANPDGTPVGMPPDQGFDLWVVYLAWIVVVLALYPLCRWFADLKRRRRDAWWISYL